MDPFLVSKNPMGITAVRLHYSADPEKNPAHPDAEIAEHAQKWLHAQRVAYPDPNDFEREFEINWNAGHGTRVFPEFSETYHSRAVRFLSRRVVYRGWDFGWHCYPLDTEILTANGWRPIGAVAPGDVVATLNPQTRSIEMQAVEHVTREHYRGPMYHWRTSRGSVDLAVTAQHRIFYEPRPGAPLLDRAALDLPRADLVMPVGENLDGKPIGEPRAVLLALYLAEGSTRYDGTHYYTWIWQSHDDPWMGEWLARTGWPWRYYRDTRGGRGWCSAGRDLHEWLAPFGHAREKYVPDEVKRAPAHEIRLFLEAYTRGDGTRRPAHGARRARSMIYTASRRMADDIQELYARIGVAARISVGPSGFSSQPVWRVTPRRSRTALRPRHLTISNQACDVACVTVPNGIVLVRRGHGVPIWCGNSPAALFAQIDSEGRLAVLREIVGSQQTTKDFAQAVIRRSAEWFPNHAAGFEDFCDPAGQQVKAIESERNERRDTEILAGLGIHARYEYGWSRKDGRSLVHQCLALRADGTPSLVVDGGACPTLTQAFLGRYVYPESKDGRVKDDPDDDTHPWADVMAALRYLVTGVYRKLGLVRWQLSPQTLLATPPPTFHGYGTRRKAG